MLPVCTISIDIKAASVVSVSRTTLNDWLVGPPTSKCAQSHNIRYCMHICIHNSIFVSYIPYMPYHTPHAKYINICAATLYHTIHHFALAHTNKQKKHSVCHRVARHRFFLSSCVLDSILVNTKCEKCNVMCRRHTLHVWIEINISRKSYAIPTPFFLSCVGRTDKKTPTISDLRR